MKKGEKLITSTGSKKTVLSVVDGLVALSAVNNPYKFDDWYTPETIQKNGWKKEEENIFGMPICIDESMNFGEWRLHTAASYLTSHGYEVTKRDNNQF